MFVVRLGLLLSLAGGARVLRQVRGHPAARGGHQRRVAVRRVPRVRGTLQPPQVRLPLARRREQDLSLGLRLCALAVLPPPLGGLQRGAEGQVGAEVLRLQEQVQRQRPNEEEAGECSSSRVEWLKAKARLAYDIHRTGLLA